jgi:hypothetical protein
VTGDLKSAFPKGVSVTTDHPDDRYPQERGSNGPAYSSPKVGGKNPKTHNSTVDLDNPMDSKTQSEKELVEKDHASHRCEIDLSHLSPRTDLVEVAAKGKPDEEKEVVSVESTSEATLDSEPKPAEKPSPKE